MKKRICIITSSYPRFKNDSTDAGVFVKEFALLLKKENFDVFVLAPFREGSKNDDERVKVHFFPWMAGDLGLSSHNPKNPIHMIKLLSVIISGTISTLKFIKKNNIQLCLAMWAVPSGFFAYLANIFFKTQYVVWSLGSDIWKIQEYPFGKIIIKKVLKNAKKLYANGYPLVKSVENISKRKCEFLAASRVLNTNLKEINYKKFDPKKTNFMFLGRYHENKGIDLLIDAVNLLTKDEIESSLFHIFGGGPMKQKIQQMVRENNLESNIFINSFLNADQVFSYMSKADFIVLPSRIEGIPVVLSDAMQSDKPVVLTNVGDMGNLGSEYKIGFVQEPNAKSIAEGLHLAINSNQNDLSSFHKGIKDLKDYLELKKSVLTFIKSIKSDI